MDAFDTALKRAFAEAPEPVDAGFTLRVAQAVAKKENAAGFFGLAHRVGLAAAAVTILFGLIQVAAVFGPQLLASVGLGLAQAHGALTQASLTMGLTQLMIIGLGMAGGAVVAVRAAQN